MPKPKPSQDLTDDEWFNRLTGHAGVAAENDEAATLRAALLQLDAEETTQERLEHDWQALRFRLRREGLIRDRHPPRLRALAMAASMVLAIGAGFMFWPKPSAIDIDDLSAVRGSAAQTLVLRAEHPALTAADITHLCHQGGIPLRQRSDASGALLLDLAVPEPVPAALADYLRRAGLPSLTSGKVTIVVMSSR